MTTTIHVSDTVWEHLNDLKEERGDTFDDVLRRELGLPEAETDD